MNTNYIKTVSLPKGIYGTSNLMKITRSHIGRCRIVGSNESNNVGCIFDIVNNTIVNFNGNVIGTTDSDKWKLIITDGYLMVQARQDNTDNITIHFVYES